MANDDSLAATEDTPVTFSAADLLGNDSDVDGDSLSIASVTIAADGSYTYTPPADFHGIDTVDYTVTDGSLTDTATLTLTVTPVNDAPVAQNDAVTVSEDVAVLETRLPSVTV
ncbi:Ig-like domain-containing protein [Pseudomonas stutzeri]|nr:Ig-like domain-containing protein [Stutzerimonas stutzeri]